MDTNGKRRRRWHSEQFKAEAVAACAKPGASLAGIALQRQVNANLLRRWVREASISKSLAPSLGEVAVAARAPAFVPVTLDRPRASGADRPIRVQVRRSGLKVTVLWPASAAQSCAAWLKELLG